MDPVAFCHGYAWAGTSGLCETDDSTTFPFQVKKKRHLAQLISRLQICFANHNHEVLYGLERFCKHTVGVGVKAPATACPTKVIRPIAQCIL